MNRAIMRFISRRLTHLVNAWQINAAMKRGKDATLVKLGDATLAFPLPVSNGLARSLARGTYEGDERLILDKLLDDNDRIIEFGGAIGALATTYSRKAIGPHYTLEANPKLIPIITGNLNKNQIENVKIINALADVKNGEGEFFLHQDFYSSSKLRPTTKQVTVPKIDVNALIAKHKLNVIISDIEGGEYDLFPKIDLHPINKILLEIHETEKISSSLMIVLRHLEKAGFEFCVREWRGNVLVFRK